LAAGPAPVASTAAKIGTGEATSCAQISLGGADVGGGPNRNAGDWEGSAGGCDTARVSAGDRCGVVGWLGRSGPETAGLADSTREAPMVEAVPGADGAAPNGVGTGGLSWGVPGDGLGVLVTSASRGNRGQAGGLRGGGGGLHAHGPSGARSSSPDELGWPRHQ
jgi:hypothetical protein